MFHKAFSSIRVEKMMLFRRFPVSSIKKREAELVIFGLENTGLTASLKTIFAFYLFGDSFTSME